MAIQMKAIEQHFHVELFSAVSKMARLTSNPVYADRFPRRDHPNEFHKFKEVLPLGAVYLPF